MDDINKKPKKRGRKPKKVIKNTTQNENTINDNLIIRLKHVNETNQELIEPYIKEDNLMINESNTHSEICWNCCHKFNNLIYGIPIKYINNVFYTYGDFCSLECCCRYSFDNINNHYEIISLINLYNNIINNTVDSNIQIAPHRLLLNTFGGPLTIEEYRNNFTNQNIHDLKIPHVIPIKYAIDIYDTNPINTKSHLKLYRSKPLKSEKKSIKKSMNLMIN